MTDLLDCICVYSRSCRRNCRLNNAWFKVPCCSMKIATKFNPNEQLYEIVEKIEIFEKDGYKIVGLEARTSGLLSLWIK